MGSTQTEADRAAVAAALEVFQLFRSVDRSITLGAAQSFLLIALEQGLSVTELKARSGRALGSASRYHRYLGESDRRRHLGQELVIATQSASDNRKKSLKLTPKGRRLMGEITAVIKMKPLPRTKPP